MTDTSSRGCTPAVEDTLEETSVPKSTHPRSFDLEFPEPPLHLSLDSLLAHSSPSNSSPAQTTMLEPDLDERSLDSSWASLVAEASSNEDDLQSEHTDVGSLLDVHSSDEIHSIADGVTSDDATSTDGEELEYTLREELDREHTSRSSLQRKLSRHSVSAPAPEAPIPNEDNLNETRRPSVTTYTTRRQLNQAEAHSLPELCQNGFETSYSRVTQMPTLDMGIDLNTYNYFKVLLLGRQVEQFRPEIQRKLGDVLVSQTATIGPPAPSSAARFHLVPNTFGPGAEPDFADLVAIDKLVDFDCYDLITVSQKRGECSKITLKNSQSGTEIASDWDCLNFVVSNPRWTTPDLAVICIHLDGQGTVDQESEMLARFAERHGIPYVLIRMDRGWRGDYTGAVLAESLHETIEPQREQSHWKIRPKFPVDMAAFLNLDSVQLNRHLAYVLSTGIPTSKRPLAGLPLEVEGKDLKVFDGVPRFNASFLKNLFMVLWVIGVYSFLGYHLRPIWSDHISAANSGDMAATFSTMEPVPTLATLLPSTTPSVAEIDCKSVQSNIDFASVNDLPASANDAKHFQVSVSGDNQLLVKLPRLALNRKKRSKLIVELRRPDGTIPAAVQELFDGVFSVQILPHDAHGDIEVNLIMTQPRLNETLAVSFGDRYDFELPRMKRIWSMLHDRLHDKMLNISTSLDDIRQQLSVQLHHMLQAKLSQGLASLSSCERFLSSSKSNLDYLKVSLCLKAERGMQELREGVVQQREEYVKQSKILGRKFSAGFSQAHSCILNLIQSARPSSLRSSLDNTVVADKLEAARRAANRIVSNAAKKVRA